MCLAFAFSSLSCRMNIHQKWRIKKSLVLWFYKRIGTFHKISPGHIHRKNAQLSNDVIFIVLKWRLLGLLRLIALTIAPIQYIVKTEAIKVIFRIFVALLYNTRTHLYVHKEVVKDKDLLKNSFSKLFSAVCSNEITHQNKGRIFYGIYEILGTDNLN